MSSFNTPWFNNQERNFFNHLNKSKTSNLIITSEEEDFDEEIEKKWQEEGFNTAYVPMLKGGIDYINRLHMIGDGFGTAEYYGIIAFGEAATLVLEAHTKPAHPKLCAIVAYYPTAIPPPKTKFPLAIHVLTHLCGPNIGVRSTPEVLGIQGSKKKTVRKRLDPGAGYGGCLSLAWQAYTYSAEPGFAEADLEEYDAVKEGLAFSRSLRVVRKGFRIDVDERIETVRDKHYSFTLGGLGEKAVKQSTEYAQVVYGPTLTGGVGHKELGKFYGGFFQPLPKSFSAKLLSRTVGTDRIVDELLVSMTHDREVHWLLPGVPATGKRIEVVLVSIVCIRGGGLESEHVYWDQASVLVQVGLLSASAVPAAMKKKGVEELPVMGAESARAIKRGSSVHMNELILDWDES